MIIKCFNALSGPIVFDVLRDINYIRGNHTENNKPPVPRKNELEPKNNKPAPENNERVLSILTVPQGVFAALVTGFAPNGTKVDGKLFGADDLYPEHGAMHIIELYHMPEDKWQVKVNDAKGRKKYFYHLLDIFSNYNNSCLI